MGRFLAKIVAGILSEAAGVAGFFLMVMVMFLVVAGILVAIVT